MALVQIGVLEIVRQPIFLLVGTFGILFIGLLPLVLVFHFGEAERLVRDNGLAVQFTFSLGLGSFAAARLVAREMTSGSAALVLSKPVGRGLFYVSKLTAAAFASAAFLLGSSLATLLATRMARGYFTLDWWVGIPLLAAVPAAYVVAGVLDYLRRGVFGSQAFLWTLVFLGAATIWGARVGPDGKLCPWGAHMDLRLIPAVALIYLAGLVMIAWAGLWATRLNTAPAMTLAMTVFTVGFLSDHVFGRRAPDSPLAALLYAVVPNWQHFWLADALVGGGRIPSSYVGYAAAYAVFSMLAIGACGQLLFHHAELREERDR